MLRAVTLLSRVLLAVNAKGLEPLILLASQSDLVPTFPLGGVRRHDMQGPTVLLIDARASG
ncbi:hypothetical protein D3880_20935 [Pseudomonas cavernae]|uniref:Uncharacterized protein n=1 Tax=Pseudomonas cavernae TaxID=2320867 RepID=A0A385Z5U2_9PSED|nr:hypothetical protein D3880_20935 [Pseudomonas cavernae]